MRNYNSRAVNPVTKGPGLWDMIGGQVPGLARGSLSALLGLPGDTEELIASGAPYALLSQGSIP